MNIDCTHFKICSGCSYSSITTPPKIFEEAFSFFQTHGFTLPLIQKEATSWRLRAKLAVQNGKIGLFKEGTHVVTDIPLCKVHHPQINQAVAIFKEAFLKSGLTSYNEVSNRGDLRYIQLVVERKSGRVQLSVVLHALAEKESHWKKFLEELWIADQEKTLWHSIWVNYNPKKTNTIFGTQWRHLFGDECLWETLLGVEIPYGPSHFGQANLSLFEALLSDLKASIKEGAKVVEFYGGCGAIGLAVASKCSSLTISEREPSAEKYFELAKAKLFSKPLSSSSLSIKQDQISFVVGKADDMTATLQDADTCIVDPPRKGLERAFIQALLHQPSINSLIYVSCNFDSLKRDCEEMLVQGWKIVAVKSYLFFPGTNHIELLIVFTR
ncbi:MAG: rumA [Chlamydiia bacterium]|nr:rumA [Chlamydiia bacterium]